MKPFLIEMCWSWLRAASNNAGQWLCREDCFDHYMEGVIDAYLELIQKGIRDMCLPSFGAHTPAEFDWIDRKARKARVMTLPIRKQARNKAGTPIPDYFHCNRVLFAPGSEEKALELKHLLESTEHTRERKRLRTCRIGQLLGYHPDKIEEFVSRKAKGSDSSEEDALRPATLVEPSTSDRNGRPSGKTSWEVDHSCFECEYPDTGRN